MNNVEKTEIVCYTMDRGVFHMGRVMIFSHESDIDGLGCIVLGKLAFKELDYELVANPEKLEEKFRTFLEEGKLKDYDFVFITDLALYNPSLELVATDHELRKKVAIFDHHESAIQKKCNIYDFTTIISCDESGKKHCGTDLFYQYLVERKYIENIPLTSCFVELTRLEDTWEWKKNKKLGGMAHDLAILFNVIGMDSYIATMLAKVRNTKIDAFVFTEEENKKIGAKKQEYKDYLSKLLEETEYFYDEHRYHFGAIFADYEYRNELAEFIVNEGNPKQIDYLVIVALDKGEYGQKSYRSIQKGFDVNKIALLHGGGGHPGAASVNITKEQREKILVLEKRDALKYLVDSKYDE